jgi:hypothetical protein
MVGWGHFASGTTPSGVCGAQRATRESHPFLSIGRFDHFHQFGP